MMMRRRFAGLVVIALIAMATVVGGTVLAEEAAEGEDHGGGWVELVSRVINFAILAGALVYLLRKPLASFLDAKTEQIRGELAEAAEKTTRAAADRKEAEARLAGLDDEVGRVRAKALEEAEAERERIQQSARAEAARLAETARKQIEGELEVARRKLTARAAELSVELARKKIKKQMNDDDQRALIDKSLESLKEAKQA
jgi:F-type H+-transporting ATPase subunit b